MSFRNCLKRSCLARRGFDINTQVISCSFPAIRSHFDDEYKNYLFFKRVALVAGGVLLIENHRRNNVKCCGIIAYVGDQDACPILLNGIAVLKNRGYDSCGIATIDPDGKICTTKFASKVSTSDSIDFVRQHAPELHSGHRIGVAHTRWATHGAKTDCNAHPHSDYKNRITLAHNGTIYNSPLIKKRLMDEGICFKSETDSEVIANLIAWHLDQGCNFRESVENCISELQGTWGLVILHKDHPNTLVCARNGSPLVLSSDGKSVFVASEPTALQEYCTQYLSLKDGEIAVLVDGELASLASQEWSKLRPVEIENSPDPYDHWTLKEIMEQPKTLAQSLNYGGRVESSSTVKLGGLDIAANTLRQSRHLLLVGCGSALYASMFGENLIAWLGGMETVRAVDACEMTEHHFPTKSLETAACFVSQSGETIDTLKACQLGEEAGVNTFSVVNGVGSVIARTTACGVYCNAGREVAVASTKAFTSQVVCLALLAVWLNHQNASSEARRQILLDSLHRLPTCVGMTIERTQEKAKIIANKIKDSHSVFVLGKGFGYPAALEGALKIKELSYIHAEGFSGGSLKHGPFALINESEKTPVILLVLSNYSPDIMINAAQQVRYWNDSHVHENSGKNKRCACDNYY
eukprot:GHVL01041665.1.p1 GENE.GHVL01041665.1~~GHVL01041665.1.p1  ORF type:complete len:637 (-),score=76.19 GHVL01041665.1:2408-4318(-)